MINYPQAAVFNMNAISERVVVAAGKVEIRPVSPRCPMSWWTESRLTQAW